MKTLLLPLLFSWSLAVAQPASDIGVQISKHIRSILQDKKGNFWFATDGDGVCRYDGKHLTYFTVKEGLCSNFVRTILEDKTGNLWFNTREGICRYDGKFFTRFTDENGLRNSGYSRSDGQNHSEDLWFGTQDGAYHYDGNSFAVLPLPIDEADSMLRHSQAGFNRSAYSIYSLLKDKNGNLWFGTEQRGVCRYDGKSFTWFREKGLSKAAVRSILQDKNGNLWFGNNGAGSYCYDGKSLTNFTEEKGLSNPDFLRTLIGKSGTLARVWTIAEDRAGNLWFGTIDAGAWRYDGKSLTNFTIKDGLSSNAIWTIYEDRIGNLWFATEGGGVCKYDGKSFVNLSKNRSGQF